MATSNPVFSETTFEAQAVRGYVPGDPRAHGALMTVSGTANKTLVLLALAVATAAVTWQQAAARPDLIYPAVLGCAIIGFLVALATTFKPAWSPVTAPIYALLEGVVLGGLSLVFNQRYPGIVGQAVGLTFGTLFSLLFAYQAGLIRVTEPFRRGVIAATGAVMLVYLASFVLGMFGVRVPFIHEAGLIGIGFSLFVVALAAANLVLDFDFIERGASHGLPKYMEWYGAFGLMVTLVWLYLEMLRLLSKLRSR